jgi:hypothetical protein
MDFRAGWARTTLVVLLAAAGAAPAAAAVHVRFELSGGAWSLDPFTTRIEDESKKVIEQEILRFMAPILKYIPPPDISQSLIIDSSGTCASLGVWVPLYKDRLEAGLKFSLVRLRVPFKLSVEQAYTILGYDIVRVNGTADGRIHFNTFIFALLGRWTFLRVGRFGWSVTAGVADLPFRGDVGGSYILTASTPLGSLTASGSDQITIEELRKDYKDIPTYLLSPYLALAWEVRLARRISLVLEAALAHGSYLSAGLTIGL